MGLQADLTSLAPVLLTIGLAIPILPIVYRKLFSGNPTPVPAATATTVNKLSAPKMAQQGSGSIMSQPAATLQPPKDTPFTPAQLAQFDGSDASKPIYVAIKGRIFDVSGKKEMYGPGAGYNVFAGKDASKGLGMSSLDTKDAIADYSDLNEAQRKTLDQWESFFEKRYNVVGQVKP